MKIGAAGKDVLSDLFVEIAAFSLLSIPGYVMVLDWLRLTSAVVIFILSMRVSVWLRKKAYDKFE
jgi:hypothetical protein